MNGYRIKVLATALGLPVGRPDRPVWLAGADLNRYMGRGEADLTDDPARALRFPTPAEAIAFWRQESPRWPTRPDGKPNRPLTAYTVEVEPVPDRPTVPLPVCPHCNATHDPRPCAAGGAVCDCCTAMFSGWEGRAAACRIIDRAEQVAS